LNFNNQKPGLNYGKLGPGVGYNHHPNFNHQGNVYKPVVINRPPGVPFLGGLATGALLTSAGDNNVTYPSPYPVSPYQQTLYPAQPYPPYPVSPYQQTPYPTQPYPPYPTQPYPPYPVTPYQQTPYPTQPYSPYQQ